MMFARSLLDDNPIYSDADYAAKSETGSIIAPPTFGRAVSQFDPDYHLRPQNGENGSAPVKTRPVSTSRRPRRVACMLNSTEYHRHLSLATNSP